MPFNSSIFENQNILDIPITQKSNKLESIVQTVSA